jgi:phycobilisome core linker protein
MAHSTLDNFIVHSSKVSGLTSSAMTAFVPAVAPSAFAGRPISPATCAPSSPAAVAPRMAYDMDGSGRGGLGPLRIKSSAVESDRRMFKVEYVLPSESRLYTFRELQNVYTVKLVPFSSWYAEQQRIQKMGGKIMKVELVSGGQMRSVCT